MFNNVWKHSVVIKLTQIQYGGFKMATENFNKLQNAVKVVLQKLWYDKNRGGKSEGGVKYRCKYLEIIF